MVILNFHPSGEDVPSKLKDSMTDWLPKVCVHHDLNCVSLEIVLCSDPELLQINKDLLSHDYYTDIITVPLDLPGFDIAGELYVSVDRVKENALDFGNGDFNHEFARVVAHGFLHLIGLNDKTDEEVKAMRAAEDLLLDMLTDS